MNELELTRLAREGDEGAISQLYHLHKEKVFHFISFRVGTVHDSEDLFQEVMLAAFDSLERFRGEVPFLHWCYQIARNKIKMFWRQNAHRETVELDDDFSGAADLGSEEMDLELGETIEAIREKIETVLQQLPENYAQILRLRFFQQMTLKECAEHLQITLGNVKVLQHRALQKAVAIAQTIS